MHDILQEATAGAAPPDVPSEESDKGGDASGEEDSGSDWMNNKLYTYMYVVGEFQTWDGQTLRRTDDELWTKISDIEVFIFIFVDIL